MNSDELAEITGDWDYLSLPANIQLGEHCWIERKDSFGRFRSTRQPGLILGNGSKVYTWTVFNVEPSGCVHVGSDCVVAGATFMCAGDIIVGNRVIISYHVTIADSDFHPVDPEQRRKDAIANAPFGDKSSRPDYETRKIVIEDDVWIGIGVIILKGIKIGKGARIGAGSVVTRDIPEGSFVEGNPARVVPLK